MRTIKTLIVLLGALGLLAGCGDSSNDVLQPGELDLEVGDLVAAGDPPVLFTTNPEFGTLIRIPPDGNWTSKKFGGELEGLAVAADGRTVLVLDKTASQVLIFDANNAELAPIRLDVGQGHNKILVSPTEPYAITFLSITDSDEIVFDGTLSLNEIRVINLQAVPTPTSTPVIVAFNPRDVVFSPEGGLAVVVSERRASFVPLAAPPTDPDNIPLDISSSEVAPPEAVIVRPREDPNNPDDLTYALIARRGSSEMFAVAIENGLGTINVVDVGIVPTDLVVTPNGEFAVAVSRGRDLASVIRLDPFGQFDTSDIFPVSLPSIIGDAVVAPADGIPEHDRRVVLFDAFGDEEELTILDTETLNARKVVLVNPPTNVIHGPDGLAIALHRRFPTSPSVSEVDAIFDANESFSLVDLDKRSANPTLVEGRPADALFSPSAGLNRAFVSVPDSGDLVVLNLIDGTAPRIHLAGGPGRLGALPDGTIFAVHDHSFGYITFINPADGTTSVARGFLLAGAL